MALNGGDEFANCLKKKLKGIHESASMLDNLYPIRTDTQRFEEQRLTGLCRRKTHHLCEYLDKLREKFYGQEEISAKAVCPEGKPEKLTAGQTAWENIEICFTDGHTVSIKAGTISGTYTYNQISMASGHNGKPTKKWLLLEAFAQTGGKISWKDPQAHAGLRKQKQLLSKILKEFFGKQTDPIDWLRDARCYSCRFGISRR